MATLTLGVIGYSIPGVGFLTGPILTAAGAYLDQRYVLPALFPKDPIQGPRLGDINLQVGDEGSPLNICLGEGCRVPGIVFWQSARHESRRTNTIGKGGGGQKNITNSYSVDVAILVCGNVIERIDKIYADSKPVYFNFSGEEEVEYESTAIEAYVEIDTRSVIIDSIVNLEVFPHVEVPIGAEELIADFVLVPGPQGGLEVGTLFTIEDDPTTYTITKITILDIDDTKYEFTPPAQTVFQVTDEITFRKEIQVSRYLVLRNTDGTVDLSRFRSGGQLQISGTNHSKDNGTFDIASVTKSGLITTVKVINSSAIAFSTGSAVGLLQSAQTESKLIDKITQYTGGPNQGPDPFLDANISTGPVPAWKEYTYVVLEGIELENWGNRLPNFEFLVRERTGRTVGEAITIILQRSGLLKTEFDTVSLTEKLLGYSFSGVQSPAQVLQPLMIAYDLAVQDRNGVLTIFKRANSPVVELTDADIGVKESFSEMQGPVEVIDVRDANLPREVRVKFRDRLRDYQAGDTAERRTASQFSRVDVIDLPLTLMPDHARSLARRILWSAHANRSKLPLSLPPSRLDIREQDLLSFPAYGKDWKAYVSKLDRGENYILEAEAIEEEVPTLTQFPIAELSLGFFGDVDFAEAPTIDLQMLDIPAIATAQETVFGIYFAAALFDTQRSWVGAQLIQSTDGGVTEAAVETINHESTIGRLISFTAINVSSLLFDRGNSMTVALENGFLESMTEAEVLNGKNYAVVGGEIIAFSTAELVASNTYLLTGLLRGQRNTEEFINGHAIGERFVFLDSGIDFHPISTSALGSVYRFKAVATGGTSGQIIGGTPGVTQNEMAQDVKLAGASIRPWAPCHAKGTRDINNNASFTWTYRSRALTKLFGPAATPLMEPVEAYEVDILGKTDQTIVERTISNVPPINLVVLTATEQTEDGYTPGDLIEVEIFQISAVIGRGKGLRATI